MAEPNFEDFSGASSPMELFARWYEDAERSEANDPNAMALATVDREGLPNVRMVLLKGLDDPASPSCGFSFFTNLESAKGREIAEHPRAALLFHWKSLRRQVRARGPLIPVTADEADAYFATRPRGSQIGAWASDQSRPLAGRETLERRVDAETARYAATAVPRPPHWSGFRLIPLEIEFWHDRPFRLHDRIVFRRPGTAAPWEKTRLYP